MSHSSLRDRHWGAAYALPVLFLVTAIIAPSLTHAADTRIAVTARAPELLPLVNCLTDALNDEGPVVETPQLTEGLEFRIGLQGESGMDRLVTITGLLKPNPSAMEPHDDDPEAQALAADRFYRLLRVHIETRAWRWRDDIGLVCREATTWMTQLRRQPILFDKLAAIDTDHPSR